MKDIVKKLSILFVILFSVSLSYSDDGNKQQDKSNKSTGQKVKRTALQDDTEDYIRCDEETYKKYSELKPKYLDIQRKIGEIDARLKMNDKNIERLKDMSDEEIDKDVRDENIKSMQEENQKLRTDRKKLEEEGIEFYKIYEPVRHKCED